MAFTHIQGQSSILASSGTGTTFLASNPTAGNVVCVYLITLAGSGSVSSIQDSMGNTYTISPSSPASETVYKVWLAYILNAPANATNSLVVTYSGSSFYIAADEFHNPSSVSFDKDAAQSDGTAGITINTPSITPSASGNLLYAGALCTANKITAPTNGNTLGGWTGGGGNIVSNFGGAGDVEYILSSSSSATAVDFTNSSSTSWAAVALSFTVALPLTIFMLGHT